MTILKETFICEFCGKELKTLRLYNKHRVTFHFDEIEDEKYVCDFCNEKFLEIKALKTHFSKMHKNINFEKYCEERKIGKACKSCGKITINGVFCDYVCREDFLRNERVEKYEKSVECKICGLKFNSIQALSRHLTNRHKEISKEEYFKKYLMKNGDPDGKCLWCGKELKFLNLSEGFQKFCYNSKCNVLWYNKNTNRKQIADANSKKTFSKGDVTPTQIGYWKKLGFSEEEAKEKVRERQTTNSIESLMQRNNCTIEEAEKIRQEITDKWQETLNSKSLEERERINRAKLLNGRGYSMISQQLFIQIYNKIKDNFEEIYFATLDTKCKRIDKNYFNEYCIKTKNGLRFLDFYIKDIRKCIEFDGDYWHGKRGNKQRDIQRDLDIKESENGIQILRVKECDYVLREEETIQKCLNFLMEGNDDR